MPQPWGLWRRPMYAHGSPILGSTFTRARSRRPKRSLPYRRPTSRSGGRSSRPPASRRSDAIRTPESDRGDNAAEAASTNATYDHQARRRSMNPVVAPLHPLFVAKITEVDLARQIDEATQRAIEGAMDTYAVCVLPDQHLADEEQIAFSRLYGSLEVEPEIGRKTGAGGRARRIASREIFDISNLDENGNIRGEQDARSSLLQITQLWHTDLSFREGSAKWSMLHAKAIPPAGGDTEYADARAAYDALPDAMKRRLVGLVAEHSAWHSTTQR